MVTQVEDYMVMRNIMNSYMNMKSDSGNISVIFKTNEDNAFYLVYGSGECMTSKIA